MPKEGQFNPSLFSPIMVKYLGQKLVKVGPKEDQQTALETGLK